MKPCSKCSSALSVGKPRWSCDNKFYLYWGYQFVPSAPVGGGGGRERVVNKRFYGEAHPGGPAFYTVEPTLTATSMQWTLFLVDSPYIDSCLNLSKMATFFCPQGGRCGEVQLYTIFD